MLMTVYFIQFNCFVSCLLWWFSQILNGGTCSSPEVCTCAPGWTGTIIVNKVRRDVVMSDIFKASMNVLIIMSVTSVDLLTFLIKITCCTVFTIMCESIYVRKITLA